MGYLQTYLDKLSHYWDDETLIELVINSDGSAWIEQAGQTHMQKAEGFVLDTVEVSDLAQQIAREGQQSLGKDNPIVSTKVEYKALSLRVQLMAPPAIEQGNALSFRIHRPSAGSEPKEFSFLRDVTTSADTERLELMKKVQAMKAPDDFLQAVVDNRLNAVISGGTSTGKTELGRRVLWMVPNEERILTIEDSPELKPKQPNSLTLVANRDETSKRSSDKLLQASLRLRPDRIILGELRGSEAVTFLDAINTGHSGSFTTIHAQSARSAMDRLALLVLATGSRLSMENVQAYLSNTIDVIIQTGRVGNQRGIQEIYFPKLAIGDQR